MSQQPPYGQPSYQPQDHARGEVLPAAQPGQPRFVPREPEPVQAAYQAAHRATGKRYGLRGAEPFWYVLGCIAFGAAYFSKLPGKKAACEVLSELQLDGRGPSRSYSLGGAEAFWYVLMCIAFGGGYFAKVSAKKALWEVVGMVQSAPGDYGEAIGRALFGPAAA
jgi:hypothetical protein